MNPESENKMCENQTAQPGMQATGLRPANSGESK